MNRRKSDLIILATVWIAALACFAVPIIDAMKSHH